MTTAKPFDPRCEIGLDGCTFILFFHEYEAVHSQGIPLVRITSEINERTREVCRRIRDAEVVTECDRDPLAPQRGGDRRTCVGEGFEDLDTRSSTAQ